MDDITLTHPKHKIAPWGKELVQKSHSTTALCWGGPAVLCGLGWVNGAQGLTSAHRSAPRTYTLISVFLKLQWPLLLPLSPCCGLSVLLGLLLPEIIKQQLDIHPKGIRYNLIAFFPYCLFSTLSTWTLMPSLWAAISFHSNFIRSPVAFEWFFPNPLGWLPWVCAVWAGIGLCFSNGKAQSQTWITWKRHVPTSPKVIASLISALLFVPIYFGEWISTSHSTPGNGWVVVSKESQSQMCFSAGFTFQGVSCCDCPCSLKLQ